MENKNQTVIIALLALIAGLILGYFFGGNTIMHNRRFFSTDSMFEEMEEHMRGEITDHIYGDEIVDGDGAMQHMMDEMLLVGRGQTGRAYEQAWLRGMIVNHLGAVELSKELLKQTDSPELINLANDIIKTQSEKVDVMKNWLET